MNKVHSRINWENHPSDATPLNEQNLNKMDVSVDELDNRVISLDTTKFDKTEAQGLFKDVSLDRTTGIITFTLYNGATKVFDTLLEKIAVNFDYDHETQQLIIMLDDGEIKYVDLSALITQYEFLDTDTVAFSIDGTGKVSAIVKEGSIEEKHLQPNYLADIKVEVSKAQASEKAAAISEKNASGSAKEAESFAHGGTGIRDGEDTDSAKYYYEQSKKMSDEVTKNCERPRGTFTGNVDELKGAGTVGSYWVQTSTATGTHPVSEDNYYLLEVTATSDNVIVQRANMFSNCKIYERMYVNKKWYDWNSITVAKFNKKPMFIYVDDDGVSTFKTIYENILQPRDIIGGLSVITDVFDGGEFTYLTQDEILDFQAKGWSILNHSCDGDVLTKDNVLVKIQYAVQRFQTLGYENRHKIFVYPDGNISDDSAAVIDCVKDYFNFGIDVTARTTNIPIIGLENKFSIGRVFINQGMDDDTKTWIYSLVDETISENKLMIISTHSYDCNQEYLAELIDYIIGKGGVFYSPDEALDYIYDSQEQLISDAMDETYYKKFRGMEDAIKDFDKYALKSIYGDSEVSLGRADGTTIGSCSIALGSNVEASGICAHAEGNKTTAGGNQAHAEGYNTYAISQQAHAEGNHTTANAPHSHAEGNNTTASGSCAHAEGYYTTADEYASHAEGYFTTASHTSAHAEGEKTTANNYASHACGKYNKRMEDGGGRSNQTGDVFVIGNGKASSMDNPSDTYSNAFRVTYKGDVYGLSAFNSSGADYAEFIKPWADGNEENEDRVGYFVTVKNGFLYKANEGDYIVGITSGNPSVVGNADEDYYWRYERDAFNRIVMEDAPETVQGTDNEGNLLFDEKTHEPIMIETGNMIKNASMKLAEDYDQSKQDDYIERKDRKEWDYVGMVGVLPVRDDGTCVAGQFCKCGKGGIATLAEKRVFDTYMVLERIAENIVSVILKP